MKRMEKTISHNTTYGIAELKQLVNKNPDLLNMKPSDIASFTGILAKLEYQTTNSHQNNWLA